jgi:hypothetical protein
MSIPGSGPGLPSADSDPLYLAALAVQRDTVVNDEMAEWEANTIGDGLCETAATDADRRRRSE